MKAEAARDAVEKLAQNSRDMDEAAGLFFWAGLFQGHINVAKYDNDLSESRVWPGRTALEHDFDEAVEVLGQEFSIAYREELNK